MKLKSFLSLFFLSVTIIVQAQTSIMAKIDEKELNKYIDLALKNYPRKKVFEANEVKAKNLLATSAFSTLDIFNVSYFYRPNQQVAVNAQNPFTVNGFQYGVTINLGSLFSKPSNIKAAKADYSAAKAQNEEYAIVLKSEVKSKYYEYIQRKANLVLRNQSTQDLKLLYTDSKLKYERNQVDIDAYTKAKNALDQATELFLASEVDFLKAKNALEDLIGAKIDEVKP